MADEKNWLNGRLGSFLLDRRYKDPSVEADLGRLYEAHNTDTGAAAIVLIPDRTLPWQPEESWSVRASSQAEPPLLVLEMERAPASGHLRGLAVMLEVIAAALGRVEDDARAHDHLLDGTLGRMARLGARVRRLLRSRSGLVVSGLAVLALGLGVGLWWGHSGGPWPSRDERSSVNEGGLEALGVLDAPTLIDKAHPNVEILAYPLPAKPFRNQSKAPCKPREGEVEINGGCWVELAKQPPCFENQAEYEGKCYLPVSLRGSEPRALQP